jgi:glycine betaine/proline transport system substrate-binding protein
MRRETFVRRARPGVRRAGLIAAGCLAALVAGLAPAEAADAALESAACRVVRLADIGWTDVTATTALFARLIRDLGYEPQITVLSVPVTYASMKNNDIDVFLGNWMPSMEADRKPFVEDHSVEVIGANLTGAKYTLAVPAYTQAAGLRDFADIARFKDALKSSIYGIEPGNDGNRLILKIIKENQFGLGDFTLVESSEQGMLAEVERAFRAQAPIVFLAWDPHPMNMRFDLRYLTGGDATFGPNFGGAAVYTNTRAGYSAACPNVGRLLANLRFTPRGESVLMAAILDEHKTPDAAAGAWLAANPATVAGWLAGVTTFDGRPAQEALEHRAAPKPGAAFEDWVMTHKIPVGDSVTQFVEYLKAHGRGFFDGVAAVVRGSTGAVGALLNGVPAPLLIAIIALGTLALRRSLPLAVFVAAALLFIMNQGYWAATLETLTLVLVAASLSTAIGVPLGIVAARRPGLYAVMRPVLDLMQTLPTFVYLTPTLVLFGLGVVPGLISTVIFALPAPIRLTHLGISSVPKPLLEAGQAFGATRLQLLVKVELPSAAPTILAGITQCIMLSLSMVVIAALVGAGGLGVPVVRALNTVQVGMGFEAGLAIVLLAIILDRITRPADQLGAS